MVVVPVCSRNVVGEPWTLDADMLMVTVPLTVAPLAGLVIAAPSGGGGGVPEFETFTVIVVVAVRPAWLPFARVVVFHVAVAVDPVTLWLEIVVVPVCSRNEVGEPWTFDADMLMVT